MRYRLCHKAFLKDRRRTRQKDRMSNKAVDGSLNHGARNWRAGPDGARHRSNTGATGAHISTGSESRAAPNTTHTWPFLYIYLQNVLKFSVQRLTEETRQILHASVALLFPPWCGRWSIQKKNVAGGGKIGGGGGAGVMVELVYKRTTKGHLLCRRASSISTCKFLKQWPEEGGEEGRYRQRVI